MIEVVEEISDEILAGAGGSDSAVGTGGMITKLEAAGITMKFGVTMYIINGENIENVETVLRGDKIALSY